MKKYFPTVKCILVPDIVTILNTDIEKYDRKGILLCMRADREKSISDTDMDSIVQVLHDKFPNEDIQYTDTVIKKCISPQSREKEVGEKLNQFAKSKLVVTDRLHGMIFAAITGTPCIALSNSNGKVPAVYEWIKNNEYIIFIENCSKVSEVLSKINLDKKYTYDKERIKEEFSPLLKIIKGKGFI